MVNLPLSVIELSYLRFGRVFSSFMFGLYAPRENKGDAQQVIGREGETAALLFSLSF